MAYGLHLILLLAISNQILADTVETDVEIVTWPNELNSSIDSEAENFLVQLNREVGKWWNRETLSLWAYDSNITQANLDEKVHVWSESAAFTKAEWPVVASFPWQEIQDYGLRRQFSKHVRLGTQALSIQDYAEYIRITTDMEGIYSSATVCSYADASKCDLALDPELEDLFMSSRDPEELKDAWVKWRKATGEPIKPMFPKYVELSNKAARLNNVSDMAAFWLQEYDTDNFTDQIETLWQQIKPFYLELHAYVRHQLRKEYGEDIVSCEGPMPAHLLGNMWAQTWENIAAFSTPYPGKTLPDPTENLVAQKYNASGIFHLADSFFVSLNLSAVPESFWTKSILEKPEDPNRELVCHPSSYDFFDGKDFRIRQCTDITSDDFFSAHTQMGFVQYYIQCKDLPVIFRDGANPGFQPAIGDVIALSVATTEHLKRINLLDQDIEEDPEATLNYLYGKALEKITLLPFAHALERWRFDVFRGKITPDNYNCEWWKLVDEIQGIEPPVDRSEEDLDPVAKYHIAADLEYLRYFVANVIQFQFHKSLCELAGQYDPNNPSEKPLHRCDIYQSTEAGNRLGSMLKLGSSRTWQDAMEVVTGQREMDATGLLEYFNPLHEWLKAKNKETGAYVGWTSSSKRCVQTRAELQAEETTSES